MTIVLDQQAIASPDGTLPPNARVARGGPAELRVLSIIGTRPEAIKMAPVVRALKARSEVTAHVCVTGQHRELLDGALADFGIRVDADLDVMRPGQNAAQVMATILNDLPEKLQGFRPDCVLVHGDTTTTLAASLAAFYADIPVGHVEAGLRTGNMRAPWPEEMHRRCTSTLARLHFAPTPQARDNLCAEGVAPGTIDVTGNTAVDAVRWMREHRLLRPEIGERISRSFGWLHPERRLVLATLHRRETQGTAMAGLCRALLRLAQDSEAEIVLPVHPNPRVRDVVRRILGCQRHIHLIGPQRYAEFVWLMAKASLIVTDSGGLQEEAPSVGTPVLVVRDATERPEALETGLVRVVGTDPDRLHDIAQSLLHAPQRRRANVENPFGDGRAAERIAERLVREFVR